jgi:hypothetical protein
MVERQDGGAGGLAVQPGGQVAGQVDFPTNGERGVKGYAARSYSSGDRYPSAE